LLIAEFPVHNTPFAGRTLQEIKLREELGVNIVGVFEHARFHPAGPDTRLSEHSLPVVVGTEAEIAALDEILVIYDANYSPVVIIGGGKVGQSAVRFLKRKGVPVHLIEKDERLRERIAGMPDQLFTGDAAERDVLMAAGLEQTPGVLLTTNDDAMNIYLAVYCRRLAPEVRIVSRITHDRNMEAIRRAGADLALSHTSLGVASVIAALRKRDLVFLGEGIESYEVALPISLSGQSLGTSAIATRTGLNVIAIQEPGRLITNPTATTTLNQGGQLLMIGSQDQLRAFQEVYR
jgi:voltage-gated potassium channel